LFEIAKHGSTPPSGFNEGRTLMKIVTLLVALGCLLISPDAPAVASIYDANVVERLQLEGVQKQQMRKLIAESRARRNRIFKKYGIDPNAKPEMSLLQRASSELLANAARERAAARKILTSKQLRLYDAIISETRRRVMDAF
jgi:hypothetical protein